MMTPRGPLEYDDGRTKQSLADSTDINKILKKAQKVGSISHLVKHGAFYGDFSDVPDLLDASTRLKKGQQIFEELPSELRREFGDQFGFFQFVNDPSNVDRLSEVLPGLAAPGRQLPAVRRSAGTEVNPALRSAPADAPAAPDGDSSADQGGSAGGDAG